MAKKKPEIYIEKPDYIKCTKECFSHMQEQLINAIEQFIPEVEKCGDSAATKRLIDEMNYKSRTILQNYYIQVRIINKNWKMKELNEKEILSQEDLYELVSGGHDEWSEKSAMQMLELWINYNPQLANYNYDKIQAAFGADVTSKARVMRWVSRGLRVEHAIAKIKFDQLMYKN